MDCDVEALMELEKRRCGAISTADAAALHALLSEDYVHVHATGDIDEREGFIRGILDNPRIVERGRITVRLYGDVAILIGDQINRRRGSTAIGVMQQIATRYNGGWRFVSAQMTMKPQPQPR